MPAATIQQLFRVPLTVPLLAGGGLGTATFLVDLIPEFLAFFITPVVSSAAAWGAVALLVAMRTETRSFATLFGVATLCSSTATYYLLILVLSQRWKLGAETENFTLSHSGILSVVAANGFWLLLSIFAGATLGVLAHAIRSGPPARSAALTGITTGMLATEGTYTIIHVSFIWVGPLDSFTWARIQTASMQLLLAGLVLALIVTTRKLHHTWAVLLTSFIASISVGIALWLPLAEIRQSL
ncbi:hypothetical protein EDC02_5356 [Micromonospora sp. Llam0]|uniref:DUF6518 family protein n=1 Tax=Micromonospora sp. Llam0 TaxID=2485143 RepID=UPI000FA22CE3|nr:DUF6518 family protein [Micromonospora sp. Llam0]ROO63334.1 hypothetical protein EDC02_5356 [Micromonospora sp. Llam0]